MRKIYLLLLSFAILFFSATEIWSQTYILNEDFSSASGTVAPAQWTNQSATPVLTDVWHFNNPGNRQLNFPIMGVFAIFDSENYSLNGLPDEAILESPFFDASIGSNTFLFFDHCLTVSPGDSAFVEAFNGAIWVEIAAFTNNTSNPSSQMINASSALGGVSNAKIRFRWKGNNNHFWAVDNISVFVPLVLDMGILALANPQMPFISGTKNIELNLKNFGALNITSATIQWQLNGVLQTPYAWAGNLQFSDSATNIVIGSHNFVAGQPVHLKAWVQNPNSGFDANPLNDTLDIDISASLCGTYTIGGTSPDFQDFTEAVKVLNNAGVNCPVLFLVRDGVYDEQIEIYSIPGTGPVNTVTFRGESLDSTAAILDYTAPNSILNYTLSLNGTSWVRFENMSFQRNGTWDAKIVQLNSNAHEINFTSCQIKNNRYGIVATYASKNIQINTCSFTGNSLQYGFKIEGNNSYIFNTSGFLVHGNYFSVSGYALHIYNCTNVVFSSNRIEGGTSYGLYSEYSSGLVVKENSFENINKGIHLHYSDSIEIRQNYCNNLEGYGLYVIGTPTVCNVWNNKFLNIKNVNAVELKAPNIAFYNNFIMMKGIAPRSGILTNQDADNCKILFNSVNLTNIYPQSAAITIGDADNLQIKNNIFANNGGGYAVKMPVLPTGLQLDYNDYFTSGSKLAQHGTSDYTQFSNWQAATSMDTNSIHANPFFTSETNLSCHQILLNNTAWAGTSVSVDIDSTLRLPAPDFGAREFAPCPVDAGINGIPGLSNPLAAGWQNIHVTLQNQGTSPLTSCIISWTVNGATQANFSWSGSLSSYQNDQVLIGSYNFQSGSNYSIVAYTSAPNAQADCDHFNDTSKIDNLSTPLCGTYTIGGTAPDFVNFTEAVTVLNNAGVTCPVVFLVRDGVYNEQIEINPILGSGLVNTVTFRGESLDSTAAILDYTASNSFLNYTLNLNGALWVRFENLSFQRNGTWGANIVQLNNNTQEINFTSCQIKNNRTGIVAYYGTRNIQIEKCAFPSSNLQNGIQVDGNSLSTFQTSGFVIQHNYFNVSGYAIYTHYGANILFASNQIEGGADYGCYSDYCSNIVVKNNMFDNIDRGVHFHYVDSIEVGQNSFIGLENYGLFVNGTPAYCTVWNNKFLDVNNVNAVELRATNTAFYNNFIHLKGILPKSGILTNQYTDNSNIMFNSILLTNTNLQSTAITMGNADNLKIKNNIFANYGGGYAVKMTSMPPGLQLDYNDYFTTGSKLAQYGSIDFLQLSNWQGATLMDANSVGANPFFTSETNLSCHQILLNNTGFAGTSISVDIDSTLRLLTPDIGAREFVPCSIDAGINAIPGLSNPISAGLQNIYVTLQNQGNSTLTSCTIHWTVNGAAQANFSWSGSVLSYQNIQVLIGSYNFQLGSNYTIEAWTSAPNAQTDCDNFNDTSKIDNLSTPLCGTYTIGGTAPDFINFTEAVTILNNVGVTCPVVFLVRDGVYNEQIEINTIQGIGPVNTVTFRGESLDSTAAILDYTNANSILNYTLNLNGATWIRFEYMSFQRNGTSGANIVQLQSNTQEINFTSCQIKNNRSGIVAYFGTLNIQVKRCSFGGNLQNGFQVEGNNSNTFQTSGFVVEGNYFNVSSYAISTRYGANILVTSNLIEGGTDYGYFSEYCSDIVVANNLFDNIDRGIHFQYSDSIEVSQNKCNNLEGCGLVIIGSPAFCNVWNNKFLNINNVNAVELKGAHIIFYNNFIHLKGVSAKSGIFTDQYADHCKIFFNSINLTNTNPQSTAITLGNADNLMIKNNIFANNGGGYAIKMLSLPTGLQLDYSNYYTSGSQLARYGSTNYTQLANWKTATSMDANSLNYQPFYLSTTELRPDQGELNGAGVPIFGILLDIDGQIRDENAPDIGADEFMVDFGITDVLSPNLNCGLTANDSVTVRLKQFGDIPFNNFQLSYQVNGGTIFTEIASGSINNDIVFTFSQTQNLSGYGTYIFKIWVNNSFDDNINNDTITVYRYSHPVPQISVAQTIGCAGAITEFTANATVASGTIESYFWEFGDASVDSVQNPSHLYDTAGTYSVHLYAYSDVGCYGDTIFESPVLTTPHADFNTPDVCLGDTVFFSNLSTASSGIMSYSWDFGNSTSSTLSEPYIYYSLSDTFTVMLAALGSNGCADSIFQQVVVHPLPVLSFLNLPTTFCSHDTALLLTTQPAGASVNSSAFAGGWFYPSLAAIGNNTISMNFTDDHGCTDTLDSSVDVLQAPTATIDGLAPQYCISGENPIISGLPTGGSFSGPGISGGQFSVSNAGIGTHTIVYTFASANGCVDVAEQTVQVAEFNTFNLNFAVDSISCFGYSDGDIDLQVSFSTQNYSSLNWTTGATTEDLVGLNTGMYAVTLIDTFGCIHSDSVFLINPDPLMVSGLSQNVSCFGGGDGTVDITVSGGHSPYSFEWSNSTFTEDLANTPAGNYFVTVSDANNCSFVHDININQPDSINFIFDAVDVLCFEEASGSIEIFPSGGISPYHYLWGDASIGKKIENLAAGNYTVSIYDTNNCETKGTLSIHSPQDLTLSDSIQAPTCIFAEDASIFVEVDGGVPPYSFSWSTADISDHTSDLAAGTYYLAVTDSNLCRKNFTFTIPASEVPCLNIPNVFSPNGDGINDYWVIEGMEFVPTTEIKVLDRWGRTVFKSNGYPVPWDGKYDHKPLQSDAFFYFIDYNNGAAPITGKVSIVY